jgi:hypothetical protein
LKPNKKINRVIADARKRSDTVGEITIRWQKPPVLRIMVEQGRTRILFLSGLTLRCKQIFLHRCCFQPVRRIRQRCPICSRRVAQTRRGQEHTRHRPCSAIQTGLNDRMMPPISTTVPSRKLPAISGTWVSVVLVVSCLPASVTCAMLFSAGDRDRWAGVSPC